jgi:hypothetical protein
MASEKKRVPTYHVVPRFDIAAKGGALELGTLVGDLLKLKPLNRRDRIPVPDDLAYTPVTHRGFRETRATLREGEFGAWAKAMCVQGVGASAKVAGKKEAEETVSCDSVITTYFDPDIGYTARSLAVRGVNDHLRGVGRHKGAEVYMITGLKIAKKLSYSNANTAQAEANLDVAANLAQAPAEVGVGGRVAGGNQHIVEFTTDDIVVGFRVTRYRYVSENLLGTKKRLEAQDFLDGAEMEDDKKEELKQLELHWEEAPIEEEDLAREKAAAGAEECWVEPSGQESGNL